MIVAIVYIDAATVDNGCICVVPGSHKLGPIERRNDGNFYLPLDQWPLEKGAIEANAGDVLFFGYCTVHGSYVNGGDRPRRISGADAHAHATTRDYYDGGLTALSQVI